MVGGRRIKLRFAHLGGHNPPIIVIHGNQTSQRANGYRRYLKRISQSIQVRVPRFWVEFKQNANPYAGRTHTMTDAQKNVNVERVQNSKNGKNVEMMLRLAF